MSIIQCVKEGNLIEIKNLLRSVSIEEKDIHDWTPLMYACYYKQVNIAVYLIQHGANVNYTVWFDSPLNWAVVKNSFEIVKFLIKNNCAVNTNYGRTPLVDACQFGHLKSVKYLIKHNAHLKQKYNLCIIARYNNRVNVSSYLTRIVLKRIKLQV